MVHVKSSLYKPCHNKRLDRCKADTRLKSMTVQELFQLGKVKHPPDAGITRKTSARRSALETEVFVCE
jgi:hypothetical protein